MIHRNDDLGFLSVLYRYVSPDTFPDPNEAEIVPAERRRRQILRECRGITFDAATGNVIARKFHKFFNVGEREETQPHRIDWTRPHLRLVKADGSLLTPLVRGDRVHWATKMGVTRVSQPVQAFADERVNYARLAHEAAGLDVTVQFEWCSSEAQRIILDYPETALVLLAVRENRSGRYWPQAEVEAFARAHQVPSIERIAGNITDHADYLKEMAKATGIEGEVIVFETGERFKVKTEEYLRMHQAVAGLAQEKDVLALVLANGIDDVKPILAADLVEKLEAFSSAVNRGIDHAAADLAALFRQGYAAAGGDRKRFAIEFVQQHQEDSSFLFALWRNAQASDTELRSSARDLLSQHIARNLVSSTRVDEVRRLFGPELHWTAEIPDLDG